MLNSKSRVIIVGALTLVGLCLLVFATPVQQAVQAQQPTGSIPTVTGTPSGVIVAVYQDQQQVTVYAGPSSYLYPAVGLVLAGQELPAYGISEDQTYIQVYYPGVPDSIAWIYAPYVKIVKNGSLKTIKSPPLPPPAATPTINPTLEVAFIAQVTFTRLPTFTAPAPLVVSNYTDETATTSIPMGLLIFGFGFIGALGVLISFLRGR